MERTHANYFVNAMWAHTRGWVMYSN